MDGRVVFPGFVVLIAVLFLIVGCTNALQDALATLSETDPPTCTVSPADSSTIPPAAEITVDFSEKINTSSLVLGGSMATDCDSPVWNAPDNDSVVLRPVSAWDDGAGILAIDCRDMAGNAMSTVTVEYTVDSSMAYVISVTPDFESGVSVNAANSSVTISLDFSKSMDQASVSVGLTVDGTTSLVEGADFSLSWIDSDSLNIVPAGDWSEGDMELTIDGEDDIGNAMSSYSVDFLVDTTVPTVSSFVPSLESVLDTSDSIVVSFSETMDDASLSLSGGLLSAGENHSWNGGRTALTISPSSAWTIGALQSLSLSASDPAGNGTGTAGGAYDVAVVFVVPSPEGNDDNPGTRAQPKATIAAAVNYADSLFGTGRVHVSQGIYNVSYVSSTHIVLREGISVYGGYSGSSWATRNPDTYVSDIREASTTDVCESVFDFVNMNRAVSASGSITRSTVFDGFTVRGGGGSGIDVSSAFYIYSGASPTVSNCDIYAADSDLFLALVTEGSNGDFHDNVFYGATADWMSWTVYLAGPNTGELSFRNNTINGSYTTSYFGMRQLSLMDLTGVVEDNTIIGGNYPEPQWSDDAGVYIYQSDDVVFDGNLIIGPTGTTRVIGINVENCSPMIRNNVVHLPGAVFSSFSPYLKGMELDYMTGSVETSPSILNNTFVFGDVDGDSSHQGWTVGIYVGGDTGEVFEPRIDNNIFYTEADSDGLDEFCGLYFSYADTYPTSVQNNCFYGLGSFTVNRYYIDGVDWYDWNSNQFMVYGLSDFHDDKSFAANNRYLNPGFANYGSGDFSLTGSSDQNVRQGGRTLGDVLYDFEDNDRTVPYSIGAYEQD